MLFKRYHRHWVVTGITLLIASAVYADVDQQEAITLLQQGNILSLEQIIEHAKHHQAGKVIDTELDEDDGIYIYELEVLDADGQVWEVEMNAQSGELLEIERED
jgi:uncharacterized membrane protein YkoI